MPKGRISPQLAAVLRDKDATYSLRSCLTRGETVKISVEGKTYRVSSRSVSKDGGIAKHSTSKSKVLTPAQK